MRVRVVAHARDPLFLETLTGALRARGHVVAAATADESVVLELAVRHHPDVCLLDTGGGSAWREAAGRLRDRDPAVKVVLVSETGSATVHRAYDDHVVDAVVEQGCAFGQLATALVTTVQGGRFCTWAGRASADLRSTISLTSRERQVLEGLMRGATTSALAEELGISPCTVRTHVQGVLRKLNVHTRNRAVSVALAENLLRTVC